MTSNNQPNRSKVLIGFCRLFIPVILLGLTAFVSYPAAAQVSNSDDPASLFQRANDHYHQGAYDQAALLYRQLLDEGLKSGNLYYNLGNTYLKLGQKGPAILAYEKARRFIPGDPALRTNFELALTGVNEGATSRLRETFHALLYLAPLNRLTVMASALFFLFMILICLTLLLPVLKNKTTGKIKGWWLSLTVASGIMLLCLVSITAFTHSDQTQKQAVVLKEGINAYFEPQISETIHFQLGEGSRIYLLGTKDDWTYVKRRDGKRGWIKDGGYGEIYY